MPSTDRDVIYQQTDSGDFHFLLSSVWDSKEIKNT